LLRLDSVRPALAEDPEPRSRFLEIIRDDEPAAPSAAPEPAVAPVVPLRPEPPEVRPTIAEVDSPGAEPPAKAAAVVAVAAIPPPDLAAAPRVAAQGWFAAHMSGVILGTGIIAGVGVTLASQQIGDSLFTTSARVAELEAAVDVCEQTLADTRAVLVQAQEALGVTREQATAAPESVMTSPSQVDENPPATVAAATSAPPATAPRTVSAARHRAIRRSLDTVLAAVQKCEDDAGGGRLSRLRARIRVEPSGEVSAVELTEGASIAVCVTTAIRSRRYQAGDVAEWIRHDFVLDTKEETP
jgi:hypothetical protein